MEEKQQIFFIDKSTPLVLYGAATMGTLYYKKYKEWGLDVNAFIDKRAWEIKEFLGLPVYDIENDGLDKENVVVLLAVKNVFEHSRIAKKLYKAGYKKIIFRPYAALDGKGTKKENLLNDVYSTLTDADVFDLEKLKKIPELNPCPIPLVEEHGVISKSTECVIFYLPVTMLFSDKKGVNEERQYPILCLKPHINFVKALLGNGGEIDSYMNYCITAAENIGTVKITEAWKQNVIANRSEVFFDMLHKYNIEPDFFINKAINVIWNKERGYFNLNSGKHRATFLCAIGKNYIPVKTSLDDYEAYLTSMDANKIAKEFSEQYEDGYACPVENPYLYEIARYSENRYFNLLRKICDKLSLWYYDNGKILSQLRIYDELSESPFCDSFFNRAGYAVSKENDIQYDVAILADKGNHRNIKAQYYLVYKHGTLEVAE